MTKLFSLLNLDDHQLRTTNPSRADSAARCTEEIYRKDILSTV
ncbi:hypothetical protein [Enterococcus hirae]|nr:hypothetical protein [Enterococcus hirae]